LSYPERIVPDETEPGVVAHHAKRYEFALAWCEGREVLDAACGAGYGSALLATGGRRVLGVDLSEEAIVYARQRYRAANLEFAAMDVLALDLADASFDAVVAFETIEHVDDRERYLAEVRRVLRPDGVYLVSTPQVTRTTESPANPFHRVEYSRRDFEALLGRYFGSVELYGQRRLQTRRHRAMQRLDVLGLRRRLGVLRRGSVLLGTAPTAEATSADLVIERDGLERATELVAVCRP
jgi:ubiquinone/menaquinone biosynthesis C-methylase UbiE